MRRRLEKLALCCSSLERRARVPCSTDFAIANGVAVESSAAATLTATCTEKARGSAGGRGTGGGDGGGGGGSGGDGGGGDGGGANAMENCPLTPAHGSY